MHWIWMVRVVRGVMLVLRRFGRIVVHVGILLFQRLARRRLPGHIPRSLAMHPGLLHYALYLIETLPYV